MGAEQGNFAKEEASDLVFKVRVGVLQPEKEGQGQHVKTHSAVKGSDKFRKLVNIYESGGSIGKGRPQCA